MPYDHAMIHLPCRTVAVYTWRSLLIGHDPYENDLNGTRKCLLTESTALARALPSCHRPKSRTLDQASDIEPHRPGKNTTVNTKKSQNFTRIPSMTWWLSTNTSDEDPRYDKRSSVLPGNPRWRSFPLSGIVHSHARSVGIASTKNTKWCGRTPWWGHTRGETRGWLRHCITHRFPKIDLLVNRSTKQR